MSQTYRGRAHSPSPFPILKERLSIPEVAAAYGIRADPNGMARCPFHKHGSERHPSMKLYPAYAKCFTCGEGFDVIEFTRRLHGLASPLEAARKLDADYHLGLFPDKPLTPSERRKAKQAVRRREEDKALAEAFDTWWHSAWHTVLWYKRHLQAERERLRPQTTDTLPDDFLHILRELDIANYLLDAMTTNNEREQIDIYAGWRKKVQMIGHIRQSKSIEGTA